MKMSSVMKMSRLIGLIAALLPVPALADSVTLPPKLALAATDAGELIPTVELVDAKEARLIDRTTGPALRLARAACDAASDDQERAALLALALSYRVGEQPRGRPESALGAFLANVVGPTIHDNIEERRGRDPREPMVVATWPRAPNERAVREQDPIALRGLSWAGRLGVCEAKVVQALGRVAALGSSSPDASQDARDILEGLGLIRFNPDDRCSASG